MDNAWATYRPTADEPWNLRRVVHLHRRAGFAAPWSELQRDLSEGPESSVSRLIDGKARTDGVPEDFERISDLLADAAVSSREPGRLKAWWVYRMLMGPDPLGERLTLMWHNHFATSNQKVNDLGVMRRQNEIFRDHARGRFDELLNRVIRDPALLIWLDAQANRKEHPNENLARELMELFTLGVGNYSEKDVKEGARSLTGWSVGTGGAFREFDERHDSGEKTVLAHTGTWRGNDLVRILLDQSSTSKRLASRLCEMFMAEGAVGVAAIKSLAEGLRERNLDIGWAVETVLRSEAFFSEKNLGKRILGPVEFVIGSLQALEQHKSPPSTLVLGEWAGRLGQDLLYPPNVFGWPGGRAWITTRSIVGRTNFAFALVDGLLGGRATPLNALELFQQHRGGGDVEALVGFYSDLILGAPPPESLREHIGDSRGSKSLADPATVRRIVALLLAAPESQLA